MTANEPELIVPDWEAPANIGACFSTRNGGHSQSPFNTLNLGLNTGDQADAVHQNRLLLSGALGLDQPPVWLQQVHGTKCLRLPCKLDHPEADAAWTDQIGVCCAILSADCLPILVTNTHGSLVAAIHAGWRGLAAGVIGASIAQLPTSPKHLVACLGPAIGSDRYEVDERVYQAFTREHGESAAYFEANRKNHWKADLAGLARMQLRRAGLTRIADGTYCTATDSDRFFSYRRDQQTGRMAALIWIKKASNSAS